MQYLTEELDGRVLLELKALADGTGRVQDDADAERKIGLLGKVEDRNGRVAVVKQTEVLAFEAGDEAAFFVCDSKDEVYFVGLNFNSRDGPAGGRLDSRLCRWRHSRYFRRGLLSNRCSLPIRRCPDIGRHGAKQESEDGSRSCDEPRCSPVAEGDCHVADSTESLADLDCSGIDSLRKPIRVLSTRSIVVSTVPSLRTFPWII